MGKTSVAVIGAGLGGLCAAIKLKEAGFNNVTILEKAAKVGGTWRDNSYPGCACDTPVAMYQFSFAPSLGWSHLFPRAGEVQAYSEFLADTFNLRPNLKLGAETTSAVWDEAKSVWRLTTKSGETIEADAIVPALGQLNRPTIPEIKGRDSFKGPAFHSARWDHSVDLAGKRVGVIGSAASAVQLIPEVAKVAKHLTVFQRTPNWVIPRLDRPITEEEKALMMTASEIAQMGRDVIYANADHLFWQAFSWTKEGRDAYTRIALNQLEEQVPDAELRKKLTPDYPIGCKRILITDDFYPALMRPNVSLVTEHIEGITPEGVKTGDGAMHDLDVIVYATGFETTGWHWSMDVIGRGGKRLNDVWHEAPEAYLGITTAGFPNMFMLYGPNTNLGHNTITFMIERQVEYAVKALQALEARGAASMDVTQTAQDRFNRELQANLAKTTWADPGCHSWYKTADGRITQNWGSHTRDYARATANIALEDYTLGQRETVAAQ
ncbi:NAD(P)-binding protein [Parvibaculum sedimenti]|uniref:NAD(P)-binding protein n=1 Tax=Parvibaculum sedimenti TaxID=2608632 RepID=A0A6N6VLC2_9HYPH|nr:NAD(P)/FAD-dependent oxidoreductase [Parvibaculum sedimenti]KAB7742138.1 NAD(P)-binding protein [Parvibaculum sedimenti]